jgi:hypothetical protein
MGCPNPLASTVVPAPSVLRLLLLSPLLLRLSLLESTVLHVVLVHLHLPHLSLLYPALKHPSPCGSTAPLLSFWALWVIALPLSNVPA